MYSTRSSASRESTDGPSLEDATYGDDAYDTSPVQPEASRGKRRGHSILHGVKEPPPSSRLRRTSTSQPGSNKSYIELDSDDESFYIDQTSNGRGPVGVTESSRQASSRSARLESGHQRKADAAEKMDESRPTRSGRSRPSEQEDFGSNLKRTRIIDRKDAPPPVEKRRRVADIAPKEEVVEEDEEEVDEDQDDEEEEEEEDTSRKYSLRDRDSSKRETMNISVLGGDGGGYARRSSHSTVRSLRPGGEHVTVVQPRMYLGGKIPNFAHARYRRSNSRHHKSHGDSTRRHYDSSSDSSSDDRDNARRGGSNSNRHNNNGHTGGGNEDAQFNRYEMERLQAERDSVLPLSMGSLGAGGGDMGMGGSLRDKASQRDMLRADAAPVAVDPKLGFQSIGGLEKHVQALKEMVVLPLLYPDVFQRFDTQPPRGVLFVGPPGTGKTLTARALANSVTMSAAQGGRKVSFFMRKGADCLSKWVGEGERQLRLLFEQAKRYQPSIIFFDEIDGLAPVRSVKQDQIHASIVSTLLALMDGLDARGQVVVIGATNRPDAIDPALRRPGRFDRELFFPLPDARARSAIIEINTGSWQPPLSRTLKDWIVGSTAGYCGADLKALCAEAALVSLRRSYPQVYESTTRLDLDPTRLILGKGDFAAALNKIIPASRRGVTGSPAKSLDSIAATLLKSTLEKVMVKIRSLLPISDSESFVSDVIENGSAISSTSTMDLDLESVKTERHTKRVEQERLNLENISTSSEAWIAALTDIQESDSLGLSGIDGTESEVPGSARTSTDSSLWDTASVTSHPRLFIAGYKGAGQSELAAAALEKLEGIPCFSIDYPGLLADLNAHSPEQALVNRVQEACKASPSVIYLPSVVTWWYSAPEGMRAALLSLIEAMPSNLPVLWLSTMTIENKNHNDEWERRHIILEDKKLARLIAWLSGSILDEVVECGLNVDSKGPHTLFINDVLETERKELFHSFFGSLHLLPGRLFSARKQVIESRIKIHEPVVVVPPPVCVVPINSKNLNKNRSMRSGQSCELMESEIASKIPQPPAIMTEDGDNQCVRELRNFLRATLGELHKEKKCLVFWRPVDPENVPDYYDVISCPMDLETMRMKVDNVEYPTLSHFLRDIEQLVFNAKEYNPLTLKDVRGRSIVHAAHSMGDIVQSHAYNFKKEVGYDLFTQCDEIADRLHIPRPRPPRVGDKMSDIDAKYYTEIMHVHQRIKDEEGDEHPTAQKLLAAKLEMEQNLVAESAKIEENLKILTDQTQREEKVEAPEGPKTSMLGIVGDDESLPLEEEIADITPSSSEVIVTDSQVAKVLEASRLEEEKKEEDRLVKESIQETDVCALPIMQSLQRAMDSARKMASHFDYLTDVMVDKSSYLPLVELVAAATGLHRLSRMYMKDCDWKKFINDLEELCDVPLNKRMASSL